eukprot:3381584-Rhodomonas_salina.5
MDSRFARYLDVARSLPVTLRLWFFCHKHAKRFPAKACNPPHVQDNARCVPFNGSDPHWHLCPPSSSQAFRYHTPSWRKQRQAPSISGHVARGKWRLPSESLTWHAVGRVPC